MTEGENIVALAIKSLKQIENKINQILEVSLFVKNMCEIQCIERPKSYKMQRPLSSCTVLFTAFGMRIVSFVRIFASFVLGSFSARHHCAQHELFKHSRNNFLLFTNKRGYY